MILLAALFYVQAASPAGCDDRAKIADWLKSKHGEAHQITLVQKDHLVEIWANSADQTWTVIVTMRDGTSCLRDAGRGIIVGRPPTPAH